MRIFCNYFAFAPGRKFFGETGMAFQATKKYEYCNTPILLFLGGGGHLQENSHRLIFDQFW
jgi:hypothetical protein